MNNLIRTLLLVITLIVPNRVTQANKLLHSETIIKESPEKIKQETRYYKVQAKITLDLIILSEQMKDTSSLLK